MNTKRLFLFCLFSFIFFLCALPLLAEGTNDPDSKVATGVQAAVGGSALLLSIIPLLVPALIALIKTGSEKFFAVIPSWVLPILAPALGALIDWIGALTTGHAANPLAAAALGFAGTGIREVYDQAKTRIKSGPQPQNPPDA